MQEKSQYNNTISNSKEDSIKKAIEILQQNSEEIEDHSEIKRPNINSRKIILKIAITIIFEILCISIGIYSFCKLKNIYAFGFFILLFIIILILKTKEIIINMILLYQKFASEAVRTACLFEPSCSEYMILAIKKYGVIKGVYKGINRLLRCHSPNGGIDYP